MGCRTVKWRSGSVVEYHSRRKIVDDVEEDQGVADYADEYEELIIRDPLEGLNRVIFAFNSFLMKNAIDPLIGLYKFVAGKFLRNMISNLGNRLNDPMIFLSSLLQLDLNNAGNTLMVFGTNMTFGCLGLFDPAKNIFGLERENRTIGQALALYGVNEGFYVMLPFFGPSTLRDGIGLATSFYVDPLSYNGLAAGGERKSLTPKYLVIPKYFAQYIDTMDSAVTLDAVFIQKSLDPYVFARYSYMSGLGYSIGKLRGDKKVNVEK
jgi:phospholipid-binding lipoprotein MlaA